MLNYLQKSIDLGYAALPRAKPEQAKLAHCKLIAHRGIVHLHELENSLAAFDLALKHGVYGIEFDIRWTKDLYPVVFHDADLKRLFNTKQCLKDLTLQQLQRDFPIIPTLEQVISRYGKKMHLMAELKYEHFPQLRHQNQVLQQLFANLKPAHDFHLITLYPDLISLFDFAPQATWLLVAGLNMSSLFKRLQNSKLGGITGHYLLARNQILNYCQQHKLLLGTGFVDSKNCLYRELNRGVEWIFSNRADKMQALLQQAKGN